MQKAGVEFEWREVDIMAGGTRDTDFLRLNQNGKVPTVRLADGRVLCESNREAGGEAALKVMVQALLDSAFIARDQMTVADVALYAYTSVAHEGGFDLKKYPLMQSWPARCEQNLPQGG
ncbi:MAG: hypothetical protein AAFR91_03620 [Pseudomonadota bacterium]